MYKQSQQLAHSNKVTTTITNDNDHNQCIKGVQLKFSKNCFLYKMIALQAINTKLTLMLLYEYRFTM